MTEQTSQRIERYLELLYAKNVELNLTRVPKEEAMVRHIEDSLTLLEFLDRESGDVIDVGSGAGLPGMPLAIHRPDRKFLLADSSAKRVEFLREVVDTLGLDNVECMHARAEQLGRDKNTREHFGIAMARAVAPLEILAEMMLPLVKPDGLMLAMKAADIGEEIDQARSVIAEICADHYKLDRFEREIGGVTRAVISIEKLASTPPRFPRASLAKRWAKLKSNKKEPEHRF